MKNYIYKLKDESGKTLYGFMEAQNEKDLKQQLRKSKYYFVGAQAYSREAILNKKISLDDQLMFTRRLASLIESGVPILTAMRILWRQTEDKTLQLVISHIHRNLNDGRTIAEAIEDFPNVFSPMYRSMVSVAEKTGGATEILRRLADYLEHQKQMIMRMKKATLYPAIVVVFAILIMIGMFIFVVPTFQKVLLKLNVDLPLLTRIVMGISDMLRSWQFWFLLVVAGFGLYLTYKQLRKKDDFSYYADEMKLKIPVWGYITYMSTLSRFIHSLSMLLDSGLPILQSFQIARDTTVNRKVDSGILEVQRSVERGGSLYDAFKDVSIFPVLMIEMVGVGESSGSMVPVLDKLAAHFDEEVEYRQNKVFTIIEPALIIFVGIIVIIVLLAIYLPIFSIWQGLLR